MKARWLLACMALLLLSQFLGLAHRIAHGHSAPGESVHAPAADAQGHGDADGQLLAPLFAGHEEGDPSCQLFDALSHHEAMPSAAPVTLAHAPPGALLRETLGAFVARWAALYDARGPPARG